MIGDWWSPLIIRDLFLDVGRFDEMVEDLGISRNLLTRRLKSLIRNGVVERTAYQERPKRYEYRLTEAGRDLVPVILALTAWATAGRGQRKAFRSFSPTKPADSQFRPQVSCSECGEPLQADAVHAYAGPGGAAKSGTMLIARRLMGRAVTAPSGRRRP